MAIHELLTIKSIKNVFDNAPSRSLFVVDVDDTLIAPKDRIFRYANGINPYHKFIADFKKKYSTTTDPEERRYFIKTLANWRLTRKCQLVEEAWPPRLNDLLNNGAIVVALTQMDVGPFGPIPSMEDWRHNELTSLGLRFTECFGGQEEILLVHLTDDLSLCPRFKKGIIYNPKHTKGDVLDAFLDAVDLTPSAIFAFDDRPEHVASMEEIARKRNIPYQGYFYKAAQYLPSTPHPKIAQLQIEHLFEHSEWLSDEEAEQKLDKGL